MLRYLLFCLAMSPSLVSAEDVPAADPAVPEVPAMPMPVEDGEPMEADITITRRGDKTIHEYRVNGQIYKIKIVPDIGPAYYFVDPDGDGQMEELQDGDFDQGTKINQWTIFSW